MSMRCARRTRQAYDGEKFSVMADGEAFCRGVSVPFDRLLLRQLLLCGFLSFFCLLGGLVSQVVHTGSVVILRLQVLHLPAHEHQANHVQDDNHGQEAVKDHIHGGHVGERAGDADEQGVNKYPHLGELAAEQNLGLNLAEEAGGDDRGEHKQEHRDSNEDGTEVSEHGLERSQCQLAGAQTILRPHAGAQNGQRGDGADDDGIHKDLKDTELGLADGVIRIGGAVTGDGGAHARLIGVHTAGGTPTDRCHNGGAGEAAHSGVAGEGILEDHTDDSGELTHVGEDDDQRARHVQAGHHRDQNVGDAGHALETAGQDHAHQNGKNDTANSLVCAEHVELLSSGNTLRGQGGDQLDHEEEGVADAEHDADLLAQTAQVVSRTADPLARVVLTTVLDAQRDLAVLGAHTEDSQDPDPEHGAGAAQGDGHRHTDDIGGANGAGQRRERSGNGTDLTLFLLGKHLAEGLAHGVAKVPDLGEPQIDGQEQAAAADKDQNRNAPEPVAEVLNCLQNSHTFSPFTRNNVWFSLGLRFVSVLSALVSQWVEGGFLSATDASPSHR